MVWICVGVGGTAGATELVSVYINNNNMSN